MRKPSHRDVERIEVALILPSAAAIAAAKFVTDVPNYRRGNNLLGSYS